MKGFDYMKVAEFRAKNLKENNMTFIEIEKFNGFWWYITFEGDRSTKYISINEAIEDIKSLYGNYIDFKILI